MYSYPKIMIIILFKYIFNPHKETQQIQPLQVRVNLEIMTMKRYSPFPRIPELTEFNVIPRIHKIIWIIMSFL